MTDALTQEQKTHLVERIRRFRAAIQPARSFETFKRTLLWTVEATSALEMMRLTKKAVSGRFETVAQYLDEASSEDEIE